MDITAILRGIIGLIFLLGVTWLLSENRKKIDWRIVGTGLFMQFIFAFFVIQTWIGRWVFGGISKAIVSLLSFTAEGAQFVFGSLAIGPGQPGSLGFFFLFQVLPTIIFFASLMSVLYYLGIMQKVVQGIAWVMARLMRISGAESLSVSANIFIGQTEAPLVIKPYIAGMTRSELYTIMVSGMAHIAGGVLAAYAQMLGSAYAQSKGLPVDASQAHFAGHLLTACIIAAPCTFIVAKMLIPEKEEPATKGSVKVHVEKNQKNFIEAAAVGAGDGVRLAINVAAMLVAFIALIALVNAILVYVGDITGLNYWLANTWHITQKLSMELLFGMFFQFIAFIIGVPWADALNVGSLMGIKLVLNEFVAYSRMSEMVSSGMLSEKAIIISTYALCGFANFASIAIQIGGLSPLAENRRSDIAALGLKSLLGGTIVTLMTAAIAGMLF